MPKFICTRLGMKKARLPKNDGSISKAQLDYLIDRAIQSELEKLSKKLQKKELVQKESSVVDWGSLKVKEIFYFILGMIAASRLLNLPGPWPRDFHFDVKLSKRNMMVVLLALMVLVI